METSSTLLDPELVQTGKPVYAFRKKVFCEGMRDGIPIALGYLPYRFRWALLPARPASPRSRGFWSAC